MSRQLASHPKTMQWLFRIGRWSVGCQKSVKHSHVVRQEIDRAVAETASVPGIIKTKRIRVPMFEISLCDWQSLAVDSPAACVLVTLKEIATVLKRCANHVRTMAVKMGPIDSVDR